ncbi:MAG: SWF/SNF helicase family protein, partial [Chloroflexi bacterium]|nr:SWF/SNF helicase family protein [Chloroflexota bacterium]
YIMAGKVLDSSSFQKALRFLEQENEEDDVTPSSLAEELDANTEARTLIDALPALDTTEYDLRHLHRDLAKDVEILTEIWDLIKDIIPARDAKLEKLKELLGGNLRGQKVLIFTYYKDTARYLYRELGGEKGAAWRGSIGDPHIRRMDSGAAPRDRASLIQAFSPESNHKPEIAGTDREIDIMISTDVLSEGQNLQDCGVLVNYDLHWNPTRMVQRAGRIDRIGSGFDAIWIYNMFPDAGLERLLGLVESLNKKIQSIDRTGFLDASILGESVHPQNFNTLKRIQEEDGSVVEEQEQFIELASNEFLLQQLKSLLESGAQERLDALPDGIHSGLYKANNRGLFFYFTAPDSRNGGRQHFWRYYDITTGQIMDNRYLITNLIACAPDTPRLVGDYNVFDIQEKVINHILQSVQTQVAIEAAPKIIDPIQQTLITLLSQHMSNPTLKRTEVRNTISLLKQPATSSQIKRLKELYTNFGTGQQIDALITAIRDLCGGPAPVHTEIPTSVPQLQRRDLRLICFDHIDS